MLLFKETRKRGKKLVYPSSSKSNSLWAFSFSMFKNPSIKRQMVEWNDRNWIRKKLGENAKETTREEKETLDERKEEMVRETKEEELDWERDGMREEGWGEKEK